MKKRRYIRKRFRARYKKIVSSLRITSSIYSLVITALLSSSVTYVATARASEHITLHYIPISITPSAIDTNIGLNTLTVSNLPGDTFGEAAEVNQPIMSPVDKDVILHGDRSQKKIALTFDAEMTDAMRTAYLTGRVKSWIDNRIIDTLTKTHTEATFFLTGMWIQMYPNQTKQLAQNPLFELGSHSYSDTSFEGVCYGLEQISDTKGLEDIERTQILLKDIAGIDNRIFRFPGGCYSKKDLDMVTNIGLKVVHWDVSGADGFNQNTDLIVHNIVDTVQNGSIIILHLNGSPTAPKTADALPQIISQLNAKGYEFVKVSELLGL